MISAHGPHEGAGRDELVLAVHGQLERQLGRRLPAPVVAGHRREARDLRVQAGPPPPGIRTPLAGLWLAGDYLDSDYPRRWSAVRSGVACATAIIWNSAAGLSAASATTLWGAWRSCAGEPAHRRARLTAQASFESFALRVAQMTQGSGRASPRRALAARAVPADVAVGQDEVVS